MPPIPFPIERSGLLLPVVIGLDQDGILDRIAAGQPIPAPIPARALVDSAADVTAVAPAVVRSLVLPIAGQVTTRTAAGDVEVDVFSVSLSVRGPDPSDGLVFTVPRLFVTELAAPLPEGEVLMGLDLLLTWRMNWDGPGRQSSLDF